MVQRTLLLHLGHASFPPALPSPHEPYAYDVDQEVAYVDSITWPLDDSLEAHRVLIGDVWLYLCQRPADTGALGSRERHRKLDVAESTVKIHLQSILKKLGLSNRVQAAIYAVGHGMA